MNTIRFACPKCAQRLSGETCLEGTQIVCPACKQPMLVPTAPIQACYQLLDLRPGSPLNDVQQAHRERMKVWDRDRSPDDPRFQQQAAEKTKELNDALDKVMAYLSGTLVPSQSIGKASQPEAKPKPASPPQERTSPEPRPSSPPSQKPAPAPYSGALKEKSLSTLQWIGLGVAVILIAALLVGLVASLFQKKGPSLTDESTGANWATASENAKHAYCRAVLFELERNGTVQKYRVRVNEDFFYDGLQAVSRQQKPEDSSSRLLDLCTNLMAEASQALK